MKEKFSKIIAGSALAIGFIFIIAVLIAFPVMWLWNYVMPYMFGLKELDFSHALAISVLCSLLFRVNGSSSKKE